MFGMALRAYIRKVRRLSEAQSERGRTLWQAVLDFVRAEPLVGRARVLKRFDADGELQVTSVLHDLTESGLVFCSGSGKSAVYRAASSDELDRLVQLTEGAGLDELAWVLIYREGPLSDERLQGLLGRAPAICKAIAERLLSDGRVQRDPSGALAAKDFTIALGAASDAEGHFVAAEVRRLCARESVTVLAPGSDRLSLWGERVVSLGRRPGFRLSGRGVALTATSLASARRRSSAGARCVGRGARHRRESWRIFSCRAGSLLQRAPYATAPSSRWWSTAATRGYSPGCRAVRA
jgi:hypothetical protein